MPSAKKLGFFWGEKFFRILEMDHGIPVRVFSIDRISPVPESQSPTGPSDDLRTVALIQKTLRDEHVDISQVRLSLPAKETIIRSFVLPAMQSSQIHQAVDFEVRKYIPFNLKDLNYSFNSTVFTDNKIKKIRITFAAIRRDVFDRYVAALAQVGLNVTFSEPAPMSLMRALIYKKVVQADEKIAVVRLAKTHAEIIFADRGIPQLVRDVPLITSDDTEALNQESIKARLFNEIHVALDFYARQNIDDKSVRLLILASPETSALAQEALNESGMKGKVIDPDSLVPSQGVGDFGYVHAFGVLLTEEVSLKTVFDLSQKAPKTARMESLQIDLAQYKEIFKTAAICGVLIAGLWAFCNWGLDQNQKKVISYKSKQGMFGSYDVNELHAMIQKNKQRLDTYKSIDLSNNFALILATVPSVLKDKMWLKSMSLYYEINQAATKTSSKINEKEDVRGDHLVMTLDGVIMLNDSNKEILEINAFVNDFKDNPVLRRFFNSVAVLSMMRQGGQGDTLNSTVFSIKCEQ